MIQIYLKTTEINVHDWSRAYEQIVAIAENFPLKLIRIEAYNGFSPELDKEHFDLHVGRGTPEAHISFYGDEMSFTSRMTVRFFSNWEKQQSEGMMGRESDAGKPIFWFPPKKYADDGTLPEANGMTIGEYGYVDTEGALYEYALLAIGTMLENLLPGRAFMIAIEQEPANVEQVVAWLEGHFGELFDVPAYFDKPRLLDFLRDEYEEKKHLVGRMDQLYRKQFKRNMTFSLAHIGYEASLAYYAEVLASQRFGTFGFSDVFTPWIAATQDLMQTLALVAESHRLLLQQDDEYSQKKAGEYDLAHILKNLLDDFILWTPQQREQLALFYTNEQALETGAEDLMGTIMRMTGYRVDICPIYAEPDQLFEAFMYHDPSNGTSFRQIIDQWLVDHPDDYAKLTQKLQKQAMDEMGALEDENVLATFHAESNQEMRAFVDQYPAHEQFFIEKALALNPDYIRIEEALVAFRARIDDFWQSPERAESLQFMRQDSKSEKIKFIRYRIKDLRLSVHPDFERWLDEEEDKTVLLRLRQLMGVKLYDRRKSFLRHRLLWNREQWDVWRSTPE